MVRNEYKGSILVTSDKELRRNAEPFVNTLIYSEEFAERIFMSTFISEENNGEEIPLHHQQSWTQRKKETLENYLKEKDTEISFYENSKKNSFSQKFLQE